MYFFIQIVEYSLLITFLCKNTLTKSPAAAGLIYLEI